MPEENIADNDGSFPSHGFGGVLDIASDQVRKITGQRGALTVLVIEGENPGELVSYADSVVFDKVSRENLARVLIAAALQCLTEPTE